MKKIILSLTAFIVFISAVIAGGGVWYYDTTISVNGNTQTVIVEADQVIVFSLDKQVETVEFSTDSMFTIRTLEGGKWIDISNDIADYNPLRGFMVRNLNDFDLDITFKFKNVTETEKTIFQKTLKAGWNLVGPAFKNDIEKQVQIIDFLGNSNFSHLLDFTGESLVYSGENNILTKKTYSGEVPINTNTSINHIIKGDSQLLNSNELANIKVLEGIAYGIFVPNETTVPGSQEMYNCDEVSQLLGLCGPEEEDYNGGYSSTQISAANQLAAMGIINDHSNDVAGYNLEQTLTKQEMAVITRGMAGLDKKETCDSSFIDVSSTIPNTWACGSIEALLDAGLIDYYFLEPNIGNFYPENNITKTEAVYFAIKANYGNSFIYDENLNTSWKEQIITFAVSEGIVSNFTNYDSEATRGFAYETSVNAIASTSEVVEECDEVSQLLGLCGGILDISFVDAAIPLYPSQILAGTTDNEIYYIDLLAKNEDINISSIFIKTNKDLTGHIQNPEIFYNSGGAPLVVSNTTLTSTGILFEGISDLTAIENQKQSLVLGLDALYIGPKGGGNISMSNIKIEGIEIHSLDGVESGKDNLNINEEISEVGANYEYGTFDILPTKLKVNLLEAAPAFSLSNNLVNGTGNIVGLISISSEHNNNEDHNSNDLSSIITQIKLEENNFGVNVNSYKLYKLGEGLETITGSVSNGIITFDTSNFTDKNIIDNIDSNHPEYFYIEADINLSSGSNFIELKLKQNEILTNTITYKTSDVTDLETYIYNKYYIYEASNSYKINNITSIQAPTNLVITDTQTGSISLSWDTVNDAIMYYLYYSTGAGLQENQSDFTELNTITIDGLDVNTEYFFSVLALDENSEESPLSNEVSSTTLNPLPGTTASGTVTISNSILPEIDLYTDGTELPAVQSIQNEIISGASGITALQFDLTAGTGSDLTVNTIEVYIDASGTGATKDQITEISLYENSIAVENLLVQKSGTKLTSGSILFNGFNTIIGSGSTETFIVTASFLDAPSGYNKIIKASILNTAIDLQIEDNNNNAVYLESQIIDGRIINVLEPGSLNVTADSNNTDNVDSKTILAGTEQIIYSLDIEASNELMSIETVSFTLESNLKSVIGSAKLYLDDTVVATASNSDVTDEVNSIVTFDNISGLNIPMNSSELKLAIITESIGFEKIGIPVNNVSVINVSLSDAQGVDSANTIDSIALSTTGSNTFDVVPSIITFSVNDTFGNFDESSAINVIMDSGNNTNSQGGSIEATLNNIDFTTQEGATAITSIINDQTSMLKSTLGYSVEITNGAINNGDVITIVTNTQNTAIEIDENGIRYSIEGIEYSVNNNILDLGTFIID